MVEKVTCDHWSAAAVGKRWRKEKKQTTAPRRHLMRSSASKNKSFVCTRALSHNYSFCVHDNDVQWRGQERRRQETRGWINCTDNTNRTIGLRAHLQFEGGGEKSGCESEPESNGSSSVWGADSFDCPVWLCPHFSLRGGQYQTCRDTRDKDFTTTAAMETYETCHKPWTIPFAPQWTITSAPQSIPLSWP